MLWVLLLKARVGEVRGEQWDCNRGEHHYSIVVLDSGCGVGCSKESMAPREVQFNKGRRLRMIYCASYAFGAIGRPFRTRYHFCTSISFVVPYFLQLSLVPLLAGLAHNPYPIYPRLLHLPVPTDHEKH